MVLDFFHTVEAIFNEASSLFNTYGGMVGRGMLVLFGSMLVYVMSTVRGLEASDHFFRRFYPNQSDLFYFRLDFFFTTFVGFIVGIVVYSPQTFPQAFAAGLTWPSAFRLFASGRSPGGTAKP